MSTPLRERPDAPLGTLIFRAGLLPAETIENALEEGVKTGKRLGEILTERGLLKEADLARLLAGQQGLEFVTLREQIVDQSAAGLFSEDQARLFRALPYAFEEGIPVIAIADPTDEVLTRNILEAIGREDAKFVVSVRSELAEIIGQVYAGGVSLAPPPPVETEPSHEPAVQEPRFVQEHAPAPEPVAEAPAAEAVVPEPVLEAPVPEPVAEMPAPPEPAFETPVPEPVAEAVPAPAEEPGGPLPEQVPYLEAFPEQPVHQNGSGTAGDTGLNGAGPLEIVPPPDATPAPEPVAAPHLSPAPASEPAPEPEPAALRVPASDPVPEAAPVQQLVQPEPAAVTAPEPVATPPAAPSPEPVPPVVETEPPASQPAPPAEAPATHHLSVRLTNGERVDAGAYTDLEAAKQQAKALMAQVAAADDGDWPFVNGRFLKPDTIVSVDIV